MVDEDELLRMEETLTMIANTEEAIMDYAECIADKLEAEATVTLQARRYNNKSDDDWNTYMDTMHEHEKAKAQRVLELDTYMAMLVNKFGQDLPTLGWNEHNKWTKDRTEVLQDQARWHARHGVVPKQFASQLKRSQSEPNIPFNNCGSSAYIYF